MTMHSHWRLNPAIDFLNHGSFGATPSSVLNEQVRLRDELERDPIRFLAPERELEPKLDRVRDCLSRLIGANAGDLAFVRNATDGVNAVMRSFPLVRGDEVVVTNHGYNACNNAVRFAVERVGAVMRMASVPFPIRDPSAVVGAIENVLNERTRLILVDHVTSPTGLVFPVDRIVELAHRRGVRVMVDGAHAPGMLPLNLGELQADYYTANHHKWLCAPKVSGFLYVRPEYQAEVHPTIISHAYNRPRPGRSQFLAEFDWMGTHDPTPLLALPAAIEFLESLQGGGMESHMRSNRQLAIQSQAILCDVLGIESPCPEAMLGSLVSVPLCGLDREAGEKLGRELYDVDRIEVPIFQGISDPDNGPGDKQAPILRISLQAYNHLGQVERLAAILGRRVMGRPVMGGTSEVDRT